MLTVANMSGQLHAAQLHTAQHSPSEAAVGQLDAAPRVQQHLAGVQPPVDEAGRVDCRQPGRDAARKLQHVRQRQ